jgi:hypothetical protein
MYYYNYKHHYLLLYLYYLINSILLLGTFNNFQINLDHIFYIFSFYYTVYYCFLKQKSIDADLSKIYL